jgi:lysophospholipase L1-like esterase
MKTVLMLGDSLIEWGDWDTLLPDYHILNRGVAGEEVEGLSVRLAAETTDAEAVDFILIMAGTNNLLMGNLFFPAIFSTMLIRLKQLCPQSTVIVNGILPMDTTGLNTTTINKVNRELEQIAADTDCCFLDLDASYSAHCLPITKPCFMNDGVHLSTRGYQVWARAINEFLQSLQEK